MSTSEQLKAGFGEAVHLRRLAGFVGLCSDHSPAVKMIGDRGNQVVDRSFVSITRGEVSSGKSVEKAVALRERLRKRLSTVQ